MKFVGIFTIVFAASFSWAQEEIVQHELKIQANPEKIYLGDEHISVSIPNPKITSESMDIDQMDLYLEVRTNQTKGIPLYKAPSTDSKIVARLNPGDIVVTQVTGPEFEEREVAEQENRGLWREIKYTRLNGASETLYFVDYWRQFLTLYNSSRGVAITQKNLDEQIEVFSQRPKNLGKYCDDRENVFCFSWKEELGFIYLTDSFLQEMSGKEGTENRLVYNTRFVRPEDGEERWAKGYIEGRRFERRIDMPSCIRKRCVTRDLIKNNPEEIRGLFIELGIIKRPKLKKKEADKTFFVSDSMAGKDGEMPFNRWLARMERDKERGVLQKDVERGTGEDEIAYLFDIRPVKEWSVGGGYYSLEQTGDLGEYSLSELGVTLNGNLVFPIFLDFELHVMGEFLIPLINDNVGADFLAPLEMTNDILWGYPFRKSATLYFGPGITFRSMFGTESDVGLTSLFGMHMTLGFYTKSQFGFIYYGITGRDFNDGTGSPEWSVKYGYTWPKDKKDSKSLREGVFGKITGHSYEREDVDLLTDVVTTSQYEVFRFSLNFLREF